MAALSGAPRGPQFRPSSILSPAVGPGRTAVAVNVAVMARSGSPRPAKAEHDGIRPPLNPFVRVAPRTHATRCKIDGARCAQEELTGATADMETDSPTPTGT